MNGAMLAIQRGFAAGWKPDPIMAVSEWSDKHRVLVAENTREYGQWVTDRTPYLREIMDALSVHHPARRIVFMKGAQIGGTEAGLNWLGYIIHSAPGPTLIVYPSIELAEDTSKDRVTPMIRATPELSALVRENRSRDSGNTIRTKKFRGGVLKFAGSNSAISLRSRSIRNLFFDEIDGYEDDVDGEGDPILLAEERTNTYERTRKILYVSTPTLKGYSKIEKLYGKSDQRRYFIPCPLCGHMDYLTWRAADHHRIGMEEKRPETAHMVCSSCNGRVEESSKTDMLGRGEWRATAEGDGSLLGYHLSGLYSPLGWASWEKIARKFLDAGRNRQELKVWVNTSLGETWEETGDRVDEKSLLARATETWDGDVPRGVGILVASADVQKDRIEWKVVGYGAGEESWLIACGFIPGDPTRDEPWYELDAILLQEWVHESGQRMYVEVACVDSNFLADNVYRFTAPRERRQVPPSGVVQRVLAVRGGKTLGQPLVPRPTRTSYRSSLYTLCVDTGKDVLAGRLQMTEAGPGFMHLPHWVDRDYIEQMCSERKLPKHVRGKGAEWRWHKIRDRNEAWDMEVYCLAALYMTTARFIRTLGARAARFSQPVLGLDAPAPAEVVTPAPEPAGAPQAPVTPPGQRPWVNLDKDWEV